MRQFYRSKDPTNSIKVLKENIFIQQIHEEVDILNYCYTLRTKV